MWSEKYKDCLIYIDKYWHSVIHKSSLSAKNHHNLKNPDSLILPFDYITPNNNKFNYIFYWDTFFIFKGLLDTKHKWIMDKMIKNFLYLFDIYGIIPNYNSLAALNRTQPPFLTGMIIDAYVNGREGEGVLNLLRMIKSPINKKHLNKAYLAAVKEYKTVWLDENNKFNHRVKSFTLSRYGDRDIGYAHTSELESGWDFTSRFYNKCNYFLPVDLNVFLYKYELDFARISLILNNKNDRDFWLSEASKRKKQVNDLMWNSKSGFYYDYSWYKNKQSDFMSLAGFTPLWAGLADYYQAEKMVLKLAEFETEAGLTITAKKSQIKPIKIGDTNEWLQASVEELTKPKQWDYPNIWPPLEYLTIIGLLRYGFINDAKRIMINSIKTHANLFAKYGTFFEKLNSETKEPGISFQYENQSGFGWTCAIFYRYLKILDTLEKQDNIYKQPKPEIPPFELSFPH